MPMVLNDDNAGEETWFPKTTRLLSRRAGLQRCIRLSTAAVVSTGSALVASPGTSIATESVTESSNTMKSDSVSKPYAPLENLLPATRVLVLIDAAVETAQALPKQPELLDSRLQDLMLTKSKQPTTYFKSLEEAAASKTYLQIDTFSAWKKARQSEAAARTSFLVDTQQQPTLGSNPLISANEAAVQWGERNQFNRLQKQQMALERKNPMRAAFNAYTNNLLFGDRYTLTATGPEKSRLIRSDRLPDVTTVVRSDLDLRDLYRNQMLTAWDDAMAELEYQIVLQKNNNSNNNNKSASIDVSELVALLKQAQTACHEWFKFVPEQDVREALEVVRSEQESD